MLKIPMGALTGLIGAILLQSGVFFLEPQSGGEVIAYIAFFGASQEVITRLIDRRASEITEDVSTPKPTSDEDA